MSLPILFFYIALALAAFAANSILCRMALTYDTIDAASFTSIRLFSGAIVLLLLVALKETPRIAITRRRIHSALALFVYAVCFSFAYVALGTAVGALVLFGSVQITLVMIALMLGQRLHMWEWFGLLLACGGFVYLVLPSFNGSDMTVPTWAFVLMALSGVAWGVYTYLGKGSKKPLVDTYIAFALCVPCAITIMVLAYSQYYISTKGLLLAMSSGALASGIGYALWYRVLPFLSTTHAAVLQLLVPILAALGGVLFVDELLTQRLVLSGVIVLAGIGCVTYGRTMHKKM